MIWLAWGKGAAGDPADGRGKQTAHPEGWATGIMGRSLVWAMKEISPLELLLRLTARLAAGSGVIALLVWLTWVMLDVRSMQSGFTLPY